MTIRFQENANLQASMKDNNENKTDFKFQRFPLKSFQASYLIENKIHIRRK